MRHSNELTSQAWANKDFKDDNNYEINVKDKDIFGMSS